jgi:hypothetical protein
VPGVLRDGAQACCTARDDGFGQRLRIAAASHGTIEMNLAEAGYDILTDHFSSLRQCVTRRFVPPGIGTEVIAAEPQLLLAKPCLLRDLEYEATEVRGRHAGIAAELIDLIRRGLDEQGGIECPRLSHGTLNNPRMRRAQGVHTGLLAPLVSRHDVEQRLHRCGDSSG